ncbi:MFS transporter [Pseudobacillus badius]|uniref:MFS transporter n=1 Tax=Bacillus badius TaxID=1455 RepID=UPI0007B07D1E|nr:MFS transporter [Bacillus badius]KZN98483.1 multidrug transporter [Bacillus badius]MED0666139.1 MFS transporter [Bacillus badius]OCS83181.1 multidrug transporter [Bacillus badius]OVE51557.1 MFS transporter [Bacillus badius]TDW02798.1 putative MFS family arabinose efflux permease [Bacillus badius]
MRVFVYLIIFFSFFDLFTQLPIISPLAASLGATPFLTGLAVGMYSFSNTIGNILSGFLTDKKGAFQVLLAGLLLTSGALFLYHLAADAWSLLAIRFLHGLLAGFIVPAAFTYLANEAEEEKKGKGAAISGAFVGLAAIIGPAFSGIVASRTSETTVLTITGAALLLLGVLTLFLLRTSLAANQSEEPSEQMTVRDFFKSTEVVKAFIGAFLLMFSQGVLAYMLPLKVILLGNDAQTSGMLLSVFGIVAVMIFLLPTNRIFDRVKATSTLAFGMTMMGLSLALASQMEEVSLLYLCMALYGIGFAFLFPSLNSLLVGAVAPSHRGKAYGYFYAFFSFGVVAGSGVTGLLAFTVNQGFLFTGILLVLAAVGSLLKEPPVMKENQ